jgi:hypothetical protein
LEISYPWLVGIDISRDRDEQQRREGTAAAHEGRDADIAR